MTTPPIKEETVDAKPRGVFFDINANPELSPVSRSTTSSRKRLRIREKKHPITEKPKEWWEQQSRVLQKQTTKGSEYFDFDVAEHLPNSTECPAHP